MISDDLGISSCVCCFERHAPRSGFADKLWPCDPRGTTTRWTIEDFIEAFVEENETRSALRDSKRVLMFQSPLTTDAFNGGGAGPTVRRGKLKAVDCGSAAARRSRRDLARDAVAPVREFPALATFLRVTLVCRSCRVPTRTAVDFEMNIGRFSDRCDIAQGGSCCFHGNRPYDASPALNARATRSRPWRAIGESALDADARATALRPGRRE